MFMLGTAHAATTNGATWSSASAATLNLLGGGSSTIAVTGTTLGSAQTWNLSNTSNYCIPLGTTASSLGYQAQSSLSATFTPGVPNLLLYVAVWRGQSAGATGSTTYSFMSSGNPINPTIVSGLTGIGIPNGSVTGNVLSIGDTNSGFYSGILRFPGTISQLSISSNATGGSQLLTFGVSDASCNTPSTVSAPLGLNLSEHPKIFATEVEVK